MTAIGSNQTLSKRDCSEFSNSEDAPPSKRQRTDGWLFLCENSGNFCPIPDETMNHMLSYCKASALGRIGTTCRWLLYLADRAPMWRELCLHAKLSVKEGASYRLEFLSAIAKEDYQAYMSKAHFFSTDKYTKVNKARVLAYLDCAIAMDYFPDQSAFSERQIEAVFQKCHLFFEGWRGELFIPGQIDPIYNQLKIIKQTHPDCSGSLSRTASVFFMFMHIKQISKALPLRYSVCWNELNKIRLDKDESHSNRQTAKFLLSFMPLSSPTKWVGRNLAAFRNHPGDLPEAERVEIFQELLADAEIPSYIREDAKYLMANMRLENRTEKITDQEACDMLESLTNVFRISSNPRSLARIQAKIQAFRDQGRV